MKRAAKPRKPRKEHPCFAEVDEQLAKRGDCLQRVISLSGQPRTVYVATERRDTLSWKRGSTWLQATYCPFCGEELPS